MRLGGLILIGTCLGAAAPGAVMEAEVMETNQESETLRQLAEPAAWREEDYGCGPLLAPGRTFYVANAGDDAADGLSPASAWRTIRRGLPELQAGDTLLIGEGEYLEPQLEINVRRPQTGAPGRPIRIMAAPRSRVIISGAPVLDDFQRAPKWRYLWSAPSPYPVLATVWENLRNIELQRVPSAALADELPGAYWHDPAGNRLYVHFSDSRDAAANRGVRLMPVTAAAQQYAFPEAYLEGAGALGGPRDVRHGLRIHGDYVLVQGLWFKHHMESVVVGANASFRTGAPVPGLDRPLGGQHNTIEDCVFFANENAGVLLTVGAERCLVRNNVFLSGGFRGACFTQNARNNLIRRNLVHVRPPSSRVRTWASGSVLANYGGTLNAASNHWADNVVAGHSLLEWKPVSPGAIVQGNVFAGLYCSGTRGLAPDSRVVLRNNLIGPNIAWEGAPLGPGGVGGDWAAPDRAFINNAGGLGDAAAMQAARFADPAWHDYRLQSDSPLRGAGLNGYNRGPVPRQTTSVYYIGPGGNDAAAGTSERLAFRTFQRAVAALHPGDALYVLPGHYTEQLVVDRGGTEGAPVAVRAYGRGPAVLPAAEIRAPHVELAGFAIDGSRLPRAAVAPSSAVAVLAPRVALRECLVRRAAAGVHARQAPYLALYRLTIIECDRGLVLAESSTCAEVRECVIAGNRLAQTEVDGDSRAGYAAGQNCYFGPGLHRPEAEECGSLAAPPVFENPAADDFRLRWDSPTAFIAPDGQPPGAAGGVPRAPQIADAQVVRTWPTAALLHWTTPFDDTVCRVEFRPAAGGAWQTSRATAQGTVHGAGLSSLQPAAEYVCRIVAVGRRGGERIGELLGFTTPAAADAPPAQTYYVAPDGDDAAYGQAPDKAWRTLRKACATAGPGDKVLVAAGTYRDVIRPLLGGTADQRLVFRRQGAGAVVVDGEFYAAPLVLLAGCDHVTIDGFTFIHAPSGDRSGLFRFDDCQGVELLNCRMEAMTRDVGILAAVSDCRDLRLEGNLFWGGAYHLRLDGRCRNVLVRNNTFARVNIYHAVITAGTDGARFVNNIFYLPCSPKKNNPRYYLRGEVKNFSSDYNLFFSPHAHQLAIGQFQNNARVTTLLARDLDEWRNLTGHDRHSLAADPLFELMPVGHGETNANFHLRPDSPAVGAGENGADIGAFPADQRVPGRVG